ncbi:MAG: aldo/keto reductase [Deltaproteobacteria bacterium]
MEYRNLGSSGLKVSVLGLGANTFGWWIDEQSSAGVINHAMELGINFIDTADTYDKGRSEEYIGRTLKGRRPEVIIASKFAAPMGEGANDRGGSRWYIMRAVEAQPKKAQDRLHRPLPDAQTRSGDAHRGNAACPG